MPLRAITFALLLGAASPAQAQVSLDAFLGEQESCGGSPLFDAFVTSLANRYVPELPGGPPLNPNETITIPSDLSSALGGTAASDNGDHTEISVQIVGTFRGLPVREIGFAFGNGNGIWVQQIIFQASPATVEERLGAALKQGQEKVRTESNDEHTLRLVQNGGRTALVCDRSM